MSFSEFLVILIVSIFVLDVKDIKYLVKMFRRLKNFFNYHKYQVLKQLDFEDSSEENNLNYEKNIYNKDVEEIDKINFMLQKIISVDGKYEGDYSLQNIKFHYNRVKNITTDEA